MKRNQRERIDAQLQALYDRVPELNCKGLCHTSCGVIECSTREHDRIKAAGVVIPTLDEYLAQDQAGVVIVCPALSEDLRCTVYEVRPMICRLWGAADGMPCPYGCKPIDGSPLISDIEGMGMIAESLQIGGSPHWQDVDVAKVKAVLAAHPEIARPYLDRGMAADQARADKLLADMERES